MKLTNVLLTILICLIAFQKLPLKEKRSVSSGITIKNQETKEVKVISTQKDDVKHSTSFRSYANSDNSSSQRLSHNIRVGRDWTLSGGVYTRQSNYRDSVGVDIGVVKYW